MLKIGIIGCGAIGSTIAKAIEKRFKNRARLIALCDIDNAKAKKLSASLNAKLSVISQDQLFRKCSLVIEASSAKISASITRKAILAGCDVLVMSVGGLLFDKSLFKLAELKKRHIFIPSGAICGVDGLKAANIGKIKSVTLTTTKPPQGFKGAPYVIEKKIDLDKIKGDRLIFSGNALSAVGAFPANINVAATLSLAGIGAKKTKVNIVASSRVKQNIHKVEIDSESGKITTETQNVPSPDNPKTSYLAILSAIATLEGILSEVKVGT